MTTSPDQNAPAEELADAPCEKPAMRGWLHLVMAPVAMIAGLFLTALSPTLETRIAAAIYTLTAVQLFTTSAAYHRVNWTQRAEAVMRRLDHSNINIFIAGTYTPLAAALLEGNTQWALLGLIWGLAIFGVLFRLLWLGAPRWLYTVFYVAMGWVAVGWLVPLWQAGGPAVVILVIAGGIVYSLGAIAYGTQWPRLSPKWFGFHEVFHSATIIAAICHMVAIWLAVFA